MKKLTSSLVVNGGNPAVRIEVIDSNFAVRAKGYNRIQEELPTGIYTVRFQVGDVVKDKLINLQPDTPLKVNPPDLQFGSAAPMEQTRTSHEYHQVSANKVSLTATLERGHGSELFVFVRDLNPGGKGHPMQGMSLHRLDGKKLVDFHKDSQRSKERDQALWAGCTIALDPGSYRLRLATRNGPTIETIVVACPNWQSQLFLLRNNRKSDPDHFEPLDLSSATQLMARPDKGFDPSVYASKSSSLGKAAEDIRLAELARLAIENQWRGFHTKDLNNLLKGKFYDPLLGILGLHLLLMRPDPDLRSAARIHKRLQEDVLQGFPHPDVQALGFEIVRLQNKSISPAEIMSPPMLRRSWAYLLNATAQQPSIIPDGSFCWFIADCIWGNGAWLAWVAKDPVWDIGIGTSTRRSWEKSPIKVEPATGAAAQESVSSIEKKLLEFLPTLERLFDEYRDPDKLADKAKLTRDEFSLLAYLYSNFQISRMKTSPTSTSPVSMETLVRSLGIPAERIRMMIQGLLEKLAPLASYA